MRIIEVTIEYEFGDMVYLKTDPEARLRMVMSYSLNPKRVIKYELQVGDLPTSFHYAMEITKNLVEVEAAYRKLDE